MSAIKKTKEYEKKFKITSFGDEGYYGSEQMDLDLKREKELDLCQSEIDDINSNYAYR